MWRDFRSTDVSQYPINEDCLQGLAPNMTYRRPMFKIFHDLCASGDDKSEITITNRKSRSSGFTRVIQDGGSTIERDVYHVSALKNKRSVDIDCSQSMHMQRKLQGNELRKAITRQG